MSFSFVLSDSRVGVYAVRGNNEPASVGLIPRTKLHPIHGNNVISIREAPIPSLIQFENTKRWAIKIGQNAYVQIADLDGHLASHGGFIGMLDQVGGGCLIHAIANKKQFLEQITALRLKIVKVTGNHYTPAQKYVIGHILIDLIKFAEKVVDNEVVWASE